MNKRQILSKIGILRNREELLFLQKTDLEKGTVSERSTERLQHINSDLDRTKETIRQLEEQLQNKFI